MTEKYVETFIEEFENSKQTFENEKKTYETVKAIVAEDLRTIESALRPVTEYISSEYSEIAYVRQVSDYRQLNLNYKARHVIGFSFEYDKASGSYYLDISGTETLQKLNINVQEDSVSYEADGQSFTIEDIVERHIKYVASYVAADQYRIQ